MCDRKSLHVPWTWMAAALASCGMLSVFTPTAWAQDDGADHPASEWLEASDTEDESGSRIRTYSVLLDDEGNLKGKIFRIEGKERKRVPAARIKLLAVQEGEVVSEAETDADEGAFKIGPLKPGIYSLIGQGEGGLVAFSLNAEQSDAEDADTDQPKKDDAAEPREQTDEPERILLKEIETCALNPADIPMAMQLLQAFLGVGSGGQPAAEPDLEAMEDEPAEKADNAEMPAEEQAKSSRSGQFRGPTGKDTVPSTTLSWQAVPLQKDGSFVGMIRMLEPGDDEENELHSRPPVDMRVFIIKDGKVVAQAPCSKLGYFTIESLKPDLYSLLGVGVDAFSATTVDVLPIPKEDAGKKSDDEAAIRGGARPATIRLVSFVRQADGGSPPKFDAAGCPEKDSKAMNFIPVVTNNSIPQTNSDLGPMIVGNGPGDGSGDGGGSATGFPSVGGGGGGSVPGGGGGGGGVPGGGGGGNPDIPEIDPASAGVGLSILIGLMLLMIDLFRPR